jgi:hypothetical protein
MLLMEMLTGKCLNKSDLSNANTLFTRSRAQFNCATNDVELDSNNTYKTDGFLGTFYASMDRLRRFQMTMPFNPPYQGTPAMFGSVTDLPTIEAVVERQKQDAHLHVCIPGSTATLDMVRNMYPALRITEFIGNAEETLAALDEGICSILLIDAPAGQNMIRFMSEIGKCLVRGKVHAIVLYQSCVVHTVSSAHWYDWGTIAIRIVALCNRN